MVARRRAIFYSCFHLASMSMKICSNFCQVNSVVHPFREVNYVDTLDLRQVKFKME